MPKANTETISIITMRTEKSGSELSEKREAMFPSPDKIVIRSGEITTKKLSDSLSNFIRSLSAVVETLPESCGRYDIDELTFSLSVNGAGKISLIGELSVGVSSGITIKLKKRKVI